MGQIEQNRRPASRFLDAGGQLRVASEPQIVVLGTTEVARPARAIRSPPGICAIAFSNAFRQRVRVHCQPDSPEEPQLSGSSGVVFFGLN